MICKNTDPCFFDMLAGKAISCQNPDVMPATCLENRHNGKTIVCKDTEKRDKSKKSVPYYLSNPDKLTVAVVKIDDYVIKKEQGCKSCDFALLIGNSEGKRVAVLVELKRGTTGDGTKQIQDTLKALQDTLRKFDKVYGRIVGTQTPDIRSNNYITLQKTLKRDYHGDLKPRESKGTLPLDSVGLDGNEIVLKKIN